MVENRMFNAVKVSGNKGVNYLYASLAPILVFLMIRLGQYVGLEFFNLIPTDWLLVTNFIVDPIFISLLIFIFPTLLLLIWVYAVEKRPLIGLGFYKRGAFGELLKGLGLGALMMSAIVLLEVGTGSIQFSGAFFSLENTLNFVLIFPCWLLQSGTEELLTRGWLFPVVTKRANLPIGIAVSSLLFSALHLLNPSVSLIPLLNIALFGLLACLYLLKTDNIWGVAGMHAAWNCFQGSFFGRPVSGLDPAYAFMSFERGDVPEYLSGGGFGPEGGIFSSLVLLAVIAYLAWDLLKNKKKATL